MTTYEAMTLLIQFGMFLGTILTVIVMIVVVLMKKK